MKSNTEVHIVAGSNDSGRSIIREWMLAYCDYVQLNEPDISDDDLMARFNHMTGELMELYHSNPAQWGGNIATMLVHYKDMYERMAAKLIYRGIHENPETTRWCK